MLSSLEFVQLFKTLFFSIFQKVFFPFFQNVNSFHCLFAEFRGYISDKFPYLLEGFYKIGEIFDKDSLARLRQIDSAAFEVKKSK